MKLVSWNLNGIRAVAFWYLAINADIIGFQETKAQDDQVLEALKNVTGYHIYCSSAVKGCNGTAILSKKEPIEVTYGLNIENMTKEVNLCGVRSFST